MRHAAVTGLVVAALAATAAAQEMPASATGQTIYVYTGEHGETTFSDVARPGAARVDLPPVPETTQDARQEMDRRIERTLKVANALEQSRLAREKARAQARAEAAAARQQAPTVVYQDRYVEPADLSGIYRFSRWNEHRVDHRERHRSDRREGRRGERTLHETFLRDSD